MPWGVAAAAGIGAIGSIASGAISSNAAESAAQTQANAANNASAVQQNMFNTTQANLAPWLQGGGNALSALQQWLGLTTPPAPTQPGTGPAIQDLIGTQGTNNLVALGATGATNAPVYSVPQSAGPGWTPGQAGVTQIGYLPGQVQGSGATPTGQQWTAGAVPAAGTTGGTAPGAAPGTIANTGLTPGSGLTGPNPAAYQSSPGYAFQLQQGENAVLNNAAATGGIGGNALQALTTFGQGLANSDYQQWWNNQVQQQQTIYNMLAGLSGSGQNAAANLGTASTALGTQIGNNITGAGAALAAGQVGSANALASGLTGATQNGLLAYLASQNNSPGGINYSVPAAYNPGGTYAPQVT